MRITFTDKTAESFEEARVDLLADGERPKDPKIKKAVLSSRFKGKRGETLPLPAVGRLLVGIGRPKEVNRVRLEKLGGVLVRKLNEMGAKKATVFIDDAFASTASVEAAAHMGSGAFLTSYRFDKYLTKQKNEDKPTLSNLQFRLRRATAAESRWRLARKVGEGVFLTRDLVNEPSNVLYPAELAKRAKELSKLGVKVEALTGPKLKGMGALLGVAQGSEHPPAVVVMRWNGGGKKAPIAFVGKGVTFDTGGISIKPSGGMEEMKSDMGGSAVVIGLMRALAARKAKANVVGAVGLVENMVSGKAQRPGDIVTSLSGQTIEVLNTDAEGRLVLADVLWYVKERFKPSHMVDLATLTGAVIVALGEEYAGLFANDDKLAESLTEAAETVGEKLWRLPLGKAYDKMLDSPVADMQNITNKRGAGSITAAQFLQRFVGKTKWAHLDIAGVTLMNRHQPTAPKGASGFGVRLLDEFVRRNGG